MSLIEEFFKHPASLLVFIQLLILTKELPTIDLPPYTRYDEVQTYFVPSRRCDFCMFKFVFKMLWGNV